jgi:hypothetical protein
MPRPFSKEEPLRFFAEFGKFKFDLPRLEAALRSCAVQGVLFLANHAGTYGDKRIGPW